MSRIKRQCFLVLVATAISVNLAWSGPDSRKEEYLAMRRLVGREQFAEAIDRCKELIQKYPDYIYPYEALPEVSLYAQNLDGASTFFIGRIKDGTQLGLGYFGLGTTCFYKKDFKTAVLAFNKAIELGVGAAECFRNYEYSIEKLEGGESAIRFFTSLCHRNPENPGYWYALALAHWARFDFDKVQSCISEALARRPEDSKLLEVQAIVELHQRGSHEHERQINDLIVQANRRADLAGAELLRSHLALQDLVSWGTNLVNGYTQEIIRVGTEYGLYRWLGWGYKRLADLEIHRGEFESSLFYLAKARYSSQRAADTDLLIRTLDDEFQAQIELGNISQALEAALVSLDLSDQESNKREQANALANVALAYHELGQDNLAKDYAVEALMSVESSGREPGLLYQVYTVLGLVYEGLRNFRVALRHYEMALEYSRKAILQFHSEAICHGNIGNAYFKLGDIQEARRRFERQLKLAREGKFLREEAYALINLANYFERIQQPGRAREYLERALSLGERLRSKTIVLVASLNMGRIVEVGGDPVRALSFYERGIRSYSMTGIVWSFTTEGAVTKRELASCVNNSIRLMSSLGNPEQAFERSDLIKLQFGIASGISARERSNYGEHDSTGRRAQVLRSALEKQYTAMSKQEEGLVLMPSKRGDIKIENKIAALEIEYGNMISETSNVASALALTPVSNKQKLRQFQKSVLQPDDAILEYNVGESRTEAFLVTRDTLVHFAMMKHDVELTEMIARASMTLRRDVQKHQYWNAALAAFEPTACRDLYDLLIAPVEGFLQTIHRLIIVPDGILRSLPFECLVLPSKAGPVDRSFASAEFVGQKFETLYLIAAHMLSDRFRSLSPASGNLLAVGSQSVNSEKRNSALSNEAFLAEDYAVELGTLNGAKNELEQIREVFGDFDGFRVEPDVSKMQFKRLATGFKVLHIATHAECDDRHPLYSSLIFGDASDGGSGGRFRAFEFLGLDLNAELVVLSGCNTGRPNDSQGLNGLVSTLLESGVRSVISSLWSVDDECTAQLMGSFYKYLKLGERKSKALQLAKLDLIKSGKQDPFYWAGFVFMGDPSAVTFSYVHTDNEVQRIPVLGLWSLILLSLVVEASMLRSAKVGRHCDL